MTFPTKNSQRGVTMLLAILVLSSITAIAFSLATIIFIEIRTSGDVSRTEPTLYASQAITEEALYKVKRSVADCPANPCLAYETDINGIRLDNPPPTIQFYSSSPLIEVFKPDASKIYQLVDPNNLFAGGSFGKVDIAYLNPSSGVSVSISIVEIDPNTGDQNNLTGSTLNTATPTVLYNLNPSRQYEMTIQNNSSDTSAMFSISSYAANGTTPQGLPYVGLTVLDITARYSGLTRKYQVKIPE